VSKRRFFPILGTLQIGGGGILLLETLMSDPDSVQKALPHPPEGFLVFFRSPASEGRRLGARLTIELWDARNAFVSVLVGSRRSRILELTLIVGSAGFFRTSISSQCRLESFWMGTCFGNIFLIFFWKNHGIGTLLEIDGFFVEQVSSRKLLPRVFPEQPLPISTCYFV